MKQLLLLLLLFSIGACVNDFVEVDRVINQEDAKIEKGENVEIFYSDSVQLKIKVSGPVLERYTQDINARDEFPEGVKVEFFDENLLVSSVLTAKYGVRMVRDQKIIVRDSVVLHTENKEMLETSELIWDENTKKITTDRFVRITREDEIITAFGLRANQDFSSYELLKVVGRKVVENID